MNDGTRGAIAASAPSVMSSPTVSVYPTSILRMVPQPSLFATSLILWTEVITQTGVGVLPTSQPWKRCIWAGRTPWNSMNPQPSTTWRLSLMVERLILSTTPTQSICFWRTVSIKDGTLLFPVQVSSSFMSITKIETGAITLLILATVTVATTLFTPITWTTTIGKSSIHTRMTRSNMLTPQGGCTTGISVVPPIPGTTVQLVQRMIV